MPKNCLIESFILYHNKGVARTLGIGDTGNSDETLVTAPERREESSMHIQHPGFRMSVHDSEELVSQGLGPAELFEVDVHTYWTVIQRLADCLEGAVCVPTRYGCDRNNDLRLK